ncbi:MAG: TolC family outer membrane protein [Undibacterium sp.]|nr:TolC family outer membrane protein [Undibacterium sp.]
MTPFFSRTLLSSACALLLVQAGSAQAIGVLQAYQAALKNDPQYRAAQAESMAGKEYIAIGRSSLLPNLQYSYSSSKNKGDSNSGRGIERLDYSSLSRNISVRQTLFNTENFARFEQGKAQTLLSDAQFDSRSQDLLLRVVSSYLDAKFADEQVQLYSAQRDFYVEQRKLNDKTFEKGEVSKTDMLETQAKLDVSEATLLEAKDNALTARNNLSEMIGQEVTSLDTLNEQFGAIDLTQKSFAEWKEIAESHSPDIAAAQYALEVADKEITKSRAGHAPRVDLNASYNHGASESYQTRGQDNNIRSIGVSFVMPLYSGGYVNAVSKQAVARKEKAKSELDGTVGRTMVEIRKQLNAVSTSFNKIVALEKSVKSANLLVDATRQSIKGGMRINLDLLNAQQQLVSSKRDLAQARYTYLNSYLKLKAAAGVLGEEDVRVVAGYFTAVN